VTFWSYVNYAIICMLTVFGRISYLINSVFVSKWHLFLYVNVIRKSGTVENTLRQDMKKNQ